MDDFAHARNLVQPVQLVAPGSPLAPAQMFRNLLRENSSRTSMGFIARASRQKGVAQMRYPGPVPVAGIPISTGAAGDSRRSCRLRPARLVVRRRGQRRSVAKAAGCAPLGAKEAAREGASDPDLPSHAALLADPGGGVSPVEGWLSRLAKAPGFQSVRVWRRTEWRMGGLSARIPTAQRPHFNPSNKILWAWSNAAVARSPPCRCPRCPQRVDGGSVTMPSEAAPERNGLPFSSRPLPCGGGQLPPYF